MFIFRFIRRMFYLAIFSGIVFYGSRYVTIEGKSARAWADEFFASAEWKEGSKDLRTWIGALLKLAGDKVQEGITPKDEAALRSVIANDLKQQLAPNSASDSVKSVLEQAGLSTGSSATAAQPFKTPAAPKTPTATQPNPLRP